MQQPKLLVSFSGSCPTKLSVSITIENLVYFGIITVDNNSLEIFVRSHYPFRMIHNFASKNFFPSMISNENDCQWDLLRPPQVYYSRGYQFIRGAFHDKFPRFLGFGFFRKLAHTKNQQGTYKTSKHNGRTVFFSALVLLQRASTGVMSTSYYHLSSIHYTSSLFVISSIFASTSATKRVCRHQQSTPRPTTE